MTTFCKISDLPKKLVREQTARYRKMFPKGLTQEEAEAFCLSCKMSQAEIAILEDAFDLDLNTVARHHVNRITGEIEKIRASFK